MKKRILLSETGGTLTRNVIYSLRKSSLDYHIIGVTSHPYEIALSNADESYLVPKADDPSFIPRLTEIIHKTNPQLLHSQHDSVISVLSRHRKEISTPMFLPSPAAVAMCVDKFKSYAAWHKAGIPVAKSMEIRIPKDIETAFKMLGKSIWLRAKKGGGGAGSLPTSDAKFAQIWVDHFHGWGTFMASETLTPESITWSSIWQNGNLIVAQGRKRLYWLFGNRTVSGVTGVTGAAVTVRDKQVDELARRAIYAIDPKPHGIFSVDMTYDKDKHVRVTEINIGRFFTTIHFFTEAGLNMPDIFMRLALGERIQKLSRKINPLRPGLVWVRGMDTAPVLTTLSAIRQFGKKQ